MGPAAKDPFREGQPVPRQNYLFTSESVSEGHPDKVCDRISDEIVDLVYREARKSGMNAWDVRVACETLATTNRVVIAGEVRVPDTLLKKGKDGKPLKDAQGHPVINPSKFRSVARKAISSAWVRLATKVITCWPSSTSLASRSDASPGASVAGRHKTTSRAACGEASWQTSSSGSFSPISSAPERPASLAVAEVRTKTGSAP